VQTHRWCLRTLIVGVALLTATGGLATAQTPSQSALEGRLLQAEDGALYLYQAGARWRVLPVTLTDAQLAAIPNGGITVERLDRLPIVTPITQGEPPITVPPPAADEVE
jgi:hypothetical protein